MIDILLEEEAKIYLYHKKQKFQHYLIDVKTMQEGCVFAANVIVKPLKHPLKSKEFKVYELENQIIFYISSDFFRYFPNHNHVEIKIKKSLGKKLVCGNISPLIMKRCKT